MTDDLPKIARLRNGGDRALAEAMTDHAARLQQAVALRMDPRIAPRVDVADVLQEAFLEARKRLPKYLQEPTVPVFVWLRRVVLNTLADLHRRHLGAKMRDAGQELGIQCPISPHASSVALVGCLVGDLTSPSQAAIREETVVGIEWALDCIEQIDREVLILRHLEGLTNDEVAAVLDVKKAAANATSKRQASADRRNTRPA